MEFNTWIRPGLSAHLLPPLLLGQGIAFYLQQTFALAISLQVLILGFALHAAIGLGRAYADAPAPQLRTMVFAASLVLPTLVLGIMLIPIDTLLATAPLRSKLDDSPDHRRTFKRLVLSPGYIYALGFCLAQLWP